MKEVYIVNWKTLTYISTNLKCIDFKKPENGQIKQKKLEKDAPNPRWPGLWPEIVNGQKIFSMARGVPIWPDLKNLAIKWPTWQHWTKPQYCPRKNLSRPSIIGMDPRILLNQPIGKSLKQIYYNLVENYAFFSDYKLTLPADLESLISDP